MMSSADIGSMLVQMRMYFSAHVDNDNFNEAVVRISRIEPVSADVGTPAHEAVEQTVSHHDGYPLSSGEYQPFWSLQKQDSNLSWYHWNGCKYPSSDAALYTIKARSDAHEFRAVRWVAAEGVDYEDDVNAG